MITTASGKELELHFKTRLMERFEERFNIKDAMRFWKEAANGPSLQVIEVALVTFSDGALKDINEAADFIDDYTAQAGKTVYTLYGEIIQEINEKGFFKAKLSPEELTEQLEAPILDMAEIVNKAVTEAGKGWLSEAGQNKSQNSGQSLISMG